MILFLDFDGVLHPDPCREDAQPFCRLPLIESLLREFPDVDVVISSSWRETRAIDEIRVLFSRDIGRRIIGKTPKWQDLPELFEVIGYQRQTEIEGWLRQSGKPWEKWVALDDKPWLFKPLLSNLVVCNSAVGLNKSVLANLANKLSIH